MMKKIEKDVFFTFLTLLGGVLGGTFHYLQNAKIEIFVFLHDFRPFFDFLEMIFRNDQKDVIFWIIWGGA